MEGRKRKVMYHRGGCFCHGEYIRVGLLESRWLDTKKSSTSAMLRPAGSKFAGTEIQEACYPAAFCLHVKLWIFHRPRPRAGWFSFCGTAYACETKLPSLHQRCRVSLIFRLQYISFVSSCSTILRMSRFNHPRGPSISFFFDFSVPFPNSFYIIYQIK